MVAQRRLHAVVRGRVQMVGFRYFVVEEARALGLTGWVADRDGGGAGEGVGRGRTGWGRNGDDGGTVEVVAEGPEERLRQLEAALRRGPRHARVEAVDARWSDT